MLLNAGASSAYSGECQYRLSVAAYSGVVLWLSCRCIAGRVLYILFMQNFNIINYFYCTRTAGCSKLWAMDGLWVM